MNTIRNITKCLFWMLWLLILRFLTSPDDISRNIRIYDVKLPQYLPNIVSYDLFNWHLNCNNIYKVMGYYIRRNILFLSSVHDCIRHQSTHTLMRHLGASQVVKGDKKFVFTIRLIAIDPTILFLIWPWKLCDQGHARGQRSWLTFVDLDPMIRVGFVSIGSAVMDVA